MVDCSYKVTDFICGFPAYVDYNDTLCSALNKMLKLSSKKIKAMDEQAINRSLMSKKKTFEFKFFKSKLDNTPTHDSNLYGIVAYPESDIHELHSIMLQLGITRIPVAKNPWSKKLMGFIDLSSLNEVLGKPHIA